MTNTAHAQFIADGLPAEAGSNPAVLRVDEVLDIRLASAASRLPIIPSQLTAIPFTLTNSGNGREAFALAATFPDGTIEGFAADADGNGAFDPLHDVLIDASATTARLLPGQALALFVLVRSNSGSIANLTVTARAITGSGARGTVIAARGDDNCDAIVGLTGASASLTFALMPGGTAAEASLDKSQRVIAPDGSDKPVRGATVIYSLVARFASGGTAMGAEVADLIPAGTRYVSGSISLNGTAMSDAADADAGSFDGSSIRVALGDVPSPAVRTIQFKVIIK